MKRLWMLAIGLLVALACGDGESRPRVLIVGIDGASPRLVSEWTEEGLLPHLAEIARSGVSGRLRAHRPILSPRIWTSIATGKTPEKHGIASWVHPGEDGKPHLFTSLDRKVPALWNIASARGKVVGVVNWLNTYPPEKINGGMISDFALPGEREGRHSFGVGFARRGLGEELDADEAPGGRVTYPEELAKSVVRLAKEEPLLDVANPFIENKALPHKFFHPMLARTFRNDDLITRLALELERDLDPDILMVYLPGIDRVCHFFWGGVEPDELYPEKARFTPEAKRAAGEALRTYYRYTDGLIGKLLERFTTSDLVLIVSDHGFEAAWSEEGALSGGHDSDATLDGVLFARGRGITAGAPSGDVSVHDVTPSVLAWLGLPLAEDMDGRVMEFLSVAPTQTLATYDGIPIERSMGGADGKEEEIIEQLRSLGYVE